METTPSPAPAAPEATPEAVREHVIARLRTLYDPEIPVNIYDLGLIYEVQVTPGRAVTVRMTLTSPGCPAATILPPQVENAARAVPGVSAAKVEVVWDPPWTPERMSEAARMQLGMM